MTQEELKKQFFEDARKGNLKGLQKALDAGIDINVKSFEDTSALLYAVDNNQIGVVQFLIKNGIDVNAYDESGVTALMNAAYAEYKDIVSELIQAHADVNMLEYDSNDNALIFACYNNDPEIVQMLIDADADVNASNVYQDTPLMRASFEGNEKIVEILLYAGADVNLTNTTAEKAIDLAEKKGFKEIVIMLKEAAAYPEKYKPISNAQIAHQVKEMSIQQMRELSKHDPKLLRRLCIVSGLMEIVLGELDYSQQKALYAGTYKNVSLAVRARMEQVILKQNGGK